MNDIVESGPQDHLPAAQTSPFARVPALGGGSMNVGAVAIEQERAIAEAQGQMILAKRFPRSMASAYAELMDACKSPEFASSAFYSVPNRGSGPSIRFAEEVARAYGNFQYGHRELSRSDGKSEVEVYAWDVERNNRSTRQITVMHVVDTKNGPKVLRDQADIDNRIANVASKQIRGRILALLPKHLVAAGIAECKKTIAGTNDKPIGQRVRDMTTVFARFGVTVRHLEEYLGHSLDNTTLDELVDLTGAYNAIKEGAKPSEYFKLEGGDQAGADASKAAAIANAAKAPAATPAPTKAPAASPPPAATAAPAASPAPAPATSKVKQRATTDGRGESPPPAPPPAAKVEQPDEPGASSGDTGGGPQDFDDDSVF